MHENLIVDVAGPDNRPYRIVLLAPTASHESRTHAIPLRKLTVRVFDGTNAALFDVGTITSLRDDAKEKRRLVDEARGRLATDDWATDTVY
jgi:hypothetical protein